MPILSISGFFFTALIWLGLKVMQNETRIAVGDSNMKKLGEQIEQVEKQVEKRIDRFEQHVNTKFEKVFERIDRITNRR